MTVSLSRALARSGVSHFGSVTYVGDALQDAILILMSNLSDGVAHVFSKAPLLIRTACFFGESEHLSTSSHFQESSALFIGVGGILATTHVCTETLEAMMQNSARLMSVILASILCLVTLAGCKSNGLVIETVNDYGGNGDLPYSIADGDGFISQMTKGNTGEWHVVHRWTNGNVWDTDFMDGTGRDSSNFDESGTAISFFSGHGLLTPYGEDPAHRCSHSPECQSPPGYSSLP